MRNSVLIAALAALMILYAGAGGGFMQEKQPLAGQPAAAAPGASQAQGTSTPAKPAQQPIVHRDFTAVIKVVAPSLVLVRSLFPVMDEYRGAGTGVASGTGIIISRDGYILTNAHVIGDMETHQRFDVTEVLVLGKQYLRVRIVGVDWEGDVALAKVDLPAGWGALKPLRFAANGTTYVGQAVMKFGFPGAIETRSPTVAHGIVTNLRAYNDDIGMPFGVTDTNLSGGDSGGPLVNIVGEVVGIDAAIIRGVSGIGLYLPAENIRRILPKLYKGDVRTGWIGILPSYCRDMLEIHQDGFLREKVEAYLAEKHVPLPQAPSGVLVLRQPDPSVNSGSVLIGDVITRVNGKAPQDRWEFTQLVSEIEPGSEVALSIMRDGKPCIVKMQVSELIRSWGAKGSNAGPPSGLHANPFVF